MAFITQAGPLPALREKASDEQRKRAIEAVRIALAANLGGWTRTAFRSVACIGVGLTKLARWDRRSSTIREALDSHVRKPSASAQGLLRYILRTNQLRSVPRTRYGKAISANRLKPSICRR